MAQPVIQTSFNSGEWAPNLWARTDIEKYHSGAALLQNFFVDYRGGATIRTGSKYDLRGYKDSTTIRMIPFQAAISVGYALEFGDGYIRFHQNGNPVLETGLAITAVTKANPCVLTVTNIYTTGDVDWIYVSGVAGMTQLNGKYYKVHARDSTHVTLYDLFGNPVDSTGYSTYTSGGTSQRVYTISSPYAAADLKLLKFVQNVDVLILCNTNYNPYQLTFNSATNWTLSPITFGASISSPTGVTVTSTLSAGDVNYSYIVTAIDDTGQESDVSAAGVLASKTDLRTVAGTNVVSWTPVAGAVGYNVYKSIVSYTNPVPAGVSYGYIGNVTSTSIADSNITADFSQPPPTAANPFTTGAKVTGVTVTTPGSYTTAPTVSFAPPSTGATATGTPVLRAITMTSITTNGSNYVPGEVVTFPNGVQLTALTVGGISNGILTASVTQAGSVTTIPANPLTQVSSSGIGTGFRPNLAWGVYSVIMNNQGFGYSSAPVVTFSAGAAAGTATITAATVGNPAVPTFFQQRLALAAPVASPETIYFSRPGNYYNYDISIPAQDDDAITAPIVSGQLSNIKAMIPQPSGLIVLTDGVSYLINGGSQGSAVTPASITANAQSYIGANDVPPIVVNFDILSIPAKGSSVRDNTYNFYANVFTGTDISVFSSHLFFGFEILEWAWVEEPYKLVWAVRNDGVLLSLTFIKEQEFTAWAHHDTEGGDALYKSICTVVEPASVGFQNFIYTVVERTINGQTVQYIEYTPERATSGEVADYWTVDCGIQYNGAPATSFQGAEFLVGKTCTGLADGAIITPFVMPASGDFALVTPASKVTVGLAYEADLQTLFIDLGNPTVQSKEKKINGVALRVTETLGLKIGSDSTNAVPMKDLIIGNVGRMTNEIVIDLVTGDAFTYIDPKWQEQGQIYVKQTQPYPATVLGYIPQVAVGDTK